MATTLVRAAGAACTSPEPTRQGAASTSTDGSAVLTTAAPIRSAGQSGWASRTSAATPATCGEAIDVPELPAAPVPDPASAERMPTPGAATSGFSAAGDGPEEVKLAGRP